MKNAKTRFFKTIFYDCFMIIYMVQNFENCQKNRNKVKQICVKPVLSKRKALLVKVFKQFNKQKLVHTWRFILTAFVLTSYYDQFVLLTGLWLEHTLIGICCSIWATYRPKDESTCFIADTPCFTVNYSTSRVRWCCTSYTLTRIWGRSCCRCCCRSCCRNCCRCCCWWWWRYYKEM